jgi:outer membrane protein TolC
MTFALFFAFISTTPASALTPLTLEEALSRALDHNPTLKQAELDVKSAKWGMLGAVADALPKVTFGSSVVQMDEATVARQKIMRDVILQEYGQYINPEDLPPFAYRTMYSSHISVDQPIYNGGVEWTALRIAGTRKSIIRISREVQRRELTLSVETAYYNFCRAYQSVEVHQRTLEVTKGYLDRFRRRAELGLVSDVDVLRWEAEESNAEAALITAQNNLRLAELTLERLMGAFENRSYIPIDLEKLVESSRCDSVCNFPEINGIWEEIREESPDLKIIRNKVKLEKQNVWIASANFQPKLNFNYTYSWESDDDIELDGFETWTAGITLNFPLFSSFGNVAKYQEARISVRKAEEQAKDFETGLYIQLTAVVNDLKAASKRLQASRKMFARSDEMLKSQENRFDLGMITTLELLDAGATHLVAELNVINNTFDVLTAHAKLRRIAGDVAFRRTIRPGILTRTSVSETR